MSMWLFTFSPLHPNQVHHERLCANGVYHVLLANHPDFSNYNYNNYKRGAVHEMALKGHL